MRRFAGFVIVVAAGGACSLFVDTSGLDEGAVADGGADVALVDVASTPATEASVVADAARDAITLTLLVQSASDVLRVVGTTPTTPATEINAGLGGTSSNRRTGIYFANVGLPKGVSVETATVVLVSVEPQIGSTTSTAFYLQAADNALPWAGTLADYEQRPRTEKVRWTKMPAWTAGASYTSPELAPLLQQVVGRSDWASGNAIVVFWENDGSVGADQQRAANVTASLIVRFR